MQNIYFYLLTSKKMFVMLKIHVPNDFSAFILTINLGNQLFTNSRLL